MPPPGYFSSQVNKFLGSHVQRDKMARFVIALCRLLGEFFSKSKDKKELMEKLNAVSNALKVTRHSGQWLRQFPIINGLMNKKNISSISDICEVGARFCMAMYFTLKNMEWLVATKIMKGDGPALSKLAFKFYTYSWLFELTAGIERFISKSTRDRSAKDVIAIVRSTLLLIEGVGTVGWQKVNGKALALIGMSTSAYDCYSTW
eukprot:CAMPEP_0174330906 /NCGR_PEP_ID=MMETSP0810-20121108/17038_1 /TAXON_ID=73025 ORGANISM="Eutreptiella gymnastica-like, Strain CCMP1594" /NCGR_SAMPLE_ID=MMETSP0810 /ASSEMBLY_ACC=CAM_ASM_000659 /LENGTH=203 /DNA_ID=CAMNT_0015446327 /DNA_START=27 /DNA_END=638 /DNA_ORIENTATION=+